MRRKKGVVYRTEGALAVYTKGGDLKAAEDDAEFLVIFDQDSRRRGTLTIVSLDVDVSYSVPADEIIRAITEGSNGKGLAFFR